MSKRAVILCGGKGTRLQPYTTVFPKPLMPIGDYPILEIVVRQLAKCGFSHITMAVSHQVELIQTFFADGAKWGVKIDYSREDNPLGTMGPLKLIKDLPDDFLMMNGDILTDLNYDKFYQCHLKKNNIFTVSSIKREHRVEYGVLDVDKNNKIRDFKEKPSLAYEISMGIYALNRKTLDFIPDGELFGFDQLMCKLIEIGKPAGACGHKGLWLDIGNPDDYVRAVDEFERYKGLFLREG